MLPLDTAITVQMIFGVMPPSARNAIGGRGQGTCDICDQTCDLLRLNHPLDERCRAITSEKFSLDDVGACVRIDTIILRKSMIPGTVWNASARHTLYHNHDSGRAGIVAAFAVS